MTETYPERVVLDPLPQSVKMYILAGIPLYTGSGRQLLPSPFEPIHLVQPLPKLEFRFIYLPCISADENEYRFDYPRDSLRIDPNLKPFPSAFPDPPKGFSGGGLWRSRSVTEVQGVIKPDEMLWLYGIQSQVIAVTEGSSRYLQAIPITHCIKMIYNHYEDLRDVLGSKFPSILPTG